jgi:hypothetical protein
MIRRSFFWVFILCFSGLALALSDSDFNPDIIIDKATFENGLEFSAGYE